MNVLEKENEQLKQQLQIVKEKCQENINKVNKFYKGKLKNCASRAHA